MLLTVNGKEEELKDGITISEFLKEKGQNEDSVVVELNNNIVKQKDYSRISLEKHDNLEIIKFVGGG